MMGTFNQQLFSKGCTCKLISLVPYVLVDGHSILWKEGLLHHWNFVALRASSVSTTSIYALQLYHGQTQSL